MKVKVVDEIITTNTAGQTVESVPVYLSDDPLDGYAPVVLETDDVGGVPVRVVADLAAENSVGQPVDALIANGISVAVAATGVLSYNGNVVLDDQIVIGGVTYSMVVALVTANDVLIGATASITNENLTAAVNGGPGEGTVYGTGTVAHPDVTAATEPGKMNVTAKVAGAAGNSIATTSTSATATWGAATLQGGSG